MNIKEKEKAIRNLLSTIDFTKLWPNFTMHRFAIYNETKVWMEGTTFPRTSQFYANTSILYNNEYIAIWQIHEDEDLEVLASKLAHEMFHAFQMKNNECRFANELDAVTTYRYDPLNLSIKLQENKLIVELLQEFSDEKFQLLLSLRKKRLADFPYEYRYEAATEQIEGTANYIELCVLKLLSPVKYQQKIEKLQTQILSIENLFPIRIVSYDIGALLIKIIIDNKQKFDFNFTDVPFAIQILDEESKYYLSVTSNPEIVAACNTFYNKTKHLIEKTTQSTECILSGDYELLGINVYDAKSYQNYLVSTYFVMYKDNDIEKILDGNFVIELNENKRIKKIWKF